MLRWPDYLADPPSDTTSGDVNAGPHGSAFVNAIFSPKVTTFEFYHEGWLHSSGVSAILAAAGSDHYAIRGRMKRGVRSPKSKPMYIDPSVVATALTAVIDSTI